LAVTASSEVALGRGLLDGGASASGKQGPPPEIDAPVPRPEDTQQPVDQIKIDHPGRAGPAGGHAPLWGGAAAGGVEVKTKKPAGCAGISHLLGRARQAEAQSRRRMDSRV